MPRKKLHKKNQRVAPPIMNPDAAGIDIGATEIYVAVPADRDPEPIRMFATFTEGSKPFLVPTGCCNAKSSRSPWSPPESTGFR